MVKTGYVNWCGNSMNGICQQSMEVFYVSMYYSTAQHIVLTAYEILSKKKYWLQKDMSKLYIFGESVLNI